jgi:hypothetical protein
MDAVAQDVAVLTLAASADFYSTHHALQACPSCYERNPVMSEPALGIALKAATVAGTTAACSRLRRDGHGRAAKVLRWTVTAVWLGIAAHNLRVSR